MKKAVVLVLVLLALSVHQLFGWSGPGHMVIGAEAYRQLSPELQKRVTEILKSHPDYEKWVQSFKPGTDVDFPLYVFMRASTWPDEIRSRGKGNPDREYSHPQWHYVDYPLRPPGFSMEPEPEPSNDALFGIAQCEKGLTHSTTLPEMRAVYLSYLIHLVGDIHQPLHCASLFDSEHPKGDKGGNDFYVKPGQRGIRLHSLWDGLLGTSGSPASHLHYAIKIETEYPRDGLLELTKDRTAKDWSLESRELAIDRAYLHGQLRGSLRPDNAPELPEGYTKEAKAVAERQAALAGYRLADEIREFVR